MKFRKRIKKKRKKKILMTTLFQISMSNEHSSSPCLDEFTPVHRTKDENWKSSPKRRSVHEIIKRFQQVSGMHNGRKSQRDLTESEPPSPNHSPRMAPQGGITNGWHRENGGKYFNIQTFKQKSEFLKNNYLKEKNTIIWPKISSKLLKYNPSSMRKEK